MMVASYSLHLCSCACLFLLLLFNPLLSARSQLDPLFYSTTCPNMTSIVRDLVKEAVQEEPRMAASLLRLHFHDCFVNGCDASDLLDDTPTFVGEKTAFPNINSLRGFGVMDKIKAAVEQACPQTVSCVDILTIATRDAIVAVNGPYWIVPLGRRDGTTANASAANANLPAPTDNLTTIISKFEAVGLSEHDVVPLSGGHTIGRVQCKNAKPRLYNFNNTGAADPTMKASFLASLQGICPLNGDDTTLVSLDQLSPDLFDNKYFVDLINNEGVLQSDQELYSTTRASTVALVKIFAISKIAFFTSFTTSMVRMGNLSPLTGTEGQIRTDCKFINP